jgi:hypothetical protein
MVLLDPCLAYIKCQVEGRRGVNSIAEILVPQVEPQKRHRALQSLQSSLGSVFLCAAHRCLRWYNLAIPRSQMRELRFPSVKFACHPYESPSRHQKDDREEKMRVSLSPILPSEKSRKTFLAGWHHAYLQSDRQNTVFFTCGWWEGYHNLSEVQMQLWMNLKV